MPLLSRSPSLAQQEERRRIARQLHDGTAQNLLAIRLNLRMLEQNGLAHSAIGRVLDECQSLCDSSLQEIRTLAYLLHPPMLDQEGLIPTIRWFTQGFSRRSGINVQLQLPPSTERLPKALEQDLFLVLQEALSNVVRHSDCSKAEISMERQPDKVILQIRDFGRGISTQPSSDAEDNASAGVGIPSMRERLRQIGGRLDIESSHQGTTVTASAPLQHDGMNPV